MNIAPLNRKERPGPNRHKKRKALWTLTVVGHMVEASAPNLPMDRGGKGGSGPSFHRGYENWEGQFPCMKKESWK